MLLNFSDRTRIYFRRTSTSPGDIDTLSVRIGFQVSRQALFGFVSHSTTRTAKRPMIGVNLRNMNVKTLIFENIFFYFTKIFLPASQDAGNGIALGTKPVFSIHKCSVFSKINIKY
jgi:hypothetical protein